MPKEPIKSVSNAIVGLQKADSMPISFAGRTYDLANLTAEDRAYLTQFPEQVPYLPTTLDVSQPATA